MIWLFIALYIVIGIITGLVYVRYDYMSDDVYDDAEDYLDFMDSDKKVVIFLGVLFWPCAYIFLISIWLVKLICPDKDKIKKKVLLIPFVAGDVPNMNDPVEVSYMKTLFNIYKIYETKDELNGVTKLLSKKCLSKDIMFQMIRFYHSYFDNKDTMIFEFDELDENGFDHYEYSAKGKFISANVKEYMQEGESSR